MNKWVIEFLLGSMLLLVSQQDRPRRAEPPCRVYTDKDLLTADCSKKIMDGMIPQNLDIGIQALNISDTKFDNMTKFTFKRYTSLIHLDMANVDRINTGSPNPVITRKYSVVHIILLEKDTFSPLSKLEFLNLSNTFIGLNPELVWPPSLRELYMDGIFIQVANFKNLKKLERFSGTVNEFRSIPPFSLILPTLKYMNLQDNPIENIKVEQLASFCKLENLELDPTEVRFVLERKAYHCECIRIRKWYNSFGIRGFGISCFEYTNEDPPKCDLRFNPKALSIREQCLAALESGPPPRSFALIRNLSIIFVICSILLLILFIIYASQKVYEREKMLKEQALQNQSMEEEYLSTDEEQTTILDNT